MKMIQVDEELYRYIAAHTEYIGESASAILRRMLQLTPKEKVVESNIKKDFKIHQSSSTKENINKSIQALNDLILSEDYASKNKVVARFMLVLSTLYALDNKAFSVAAESAQGRKRVYFSNSEKTLLKNGLQTKPKPIPIPKTPYWVITNTNSQRKRIILKNVMIAMKFPREIVEEVSRTV